MGEAEYNFMKEHNPRWAAEVESTAAVYVKYIDAIKEQDKVFCGYVHGQLDGLAMAAMIAGTSRAEAFVLQAIENAKDHFYGKEV